MPKLRTPTYADIHNLAEQVADDFLHGDLNEARDTLEGLVPLAAAEVAIEVCKRLEPLARREQFLNSLAKWNGW